MHLISVLACGDDPDRRCDEADRRCSLRRWSVGRDLALSDQFWPVVIASGRENPSRGESSSLGPDRSCLSAVPSTVGAVVL
jgi:hypothetical protein